MRLIPPLLASAAAAIASLRVGDAELEGVQGAEQPVGAHFIWITDPGAEARVCLHNSGEHGVHRLHGGSPLPFRDVLPVCRYWSAQDIGHFA